MAAKQGVFRIWLVGIAKPRDFDYDCYGEGVMYAIGTSLQNMFNRVCQHKKSLIASANYTWEKGAPSQTDVVVYVLAKKSSSIINKKGGQPIHVGASGGTYRHSTGMISEVYLKEIDGAASFSKVATNLIFHEVMHNKLDASVPQTIYDIHNGGGAGLASHVVSSGSQLTPANIKIMAGALSKKVRQYSGKMQKPNS